MMSPLPASLTLLFSSYAVGCFNAGYYLVRWTRGEDIRQHFSGSTGARNVGRKLGKLGFIATFAIDAAKGGAVVLLAHHINADPVFLPWVVPLVVAGHIWPMQLRFAGGKGVATSIGAFATMLYFPIQAYSISQVTALLTTFILVLLAHRKNLRRGGLVWRNP